MTDHGNGGTIGIWPFLIARARQASFHEVLGPAFAMESPGWLAAESGYEEPLGCPRRNSAVLNGTNYQVVYRRVMANGSWADRDAGPLRDASSRPLRVVEGFVVEGTEDEPIDIENGFAASTPTIRQAFAAFWHADDDDWETVAAPTLDIARAPAQKLEASDKPPSTPATLEPPSESAPDPDDLEPIYVPSTSILTFMLVAFALIVVVAISLMGAGVFISYALAKAMRWDLPW